MRVHISLLAFVVPALCSALTAQRTWIVDANTAAIADFTDIQSAVRAAQSGDTILVRRGSYGAPEVTIGIDLLGEPGAELDTRMSMLWVHDLPRDETFVLAGFTTRRGFASRILLLNNRGRIFVEDITTPVATTGYERSAGIMIFESDFVSVNRCSLYGVPGVKVTRSRVVLNDCTITGITSWKGLVKGPALQAIDSKIDVSQPYFRGASDLNLPLASAAIAVTGGWLNVAGDVTAYLAGGMSSPTFQQPAIEADQCTVRYDSDIQLNRSGSQSPRLTGNALFVPESMVALSAKGQIHPKNEITATVRGPALAPAIVLISLPSAPVPTVFGVFWLDPASSCVFDTNFLDASGHWSTSYTAQPILPRGITLTLQAFVDTGNRLVLSLPVMITTH